MLNEAIIITFLSVINIYFLAAFFGVIGGME
jgi:hypothetical protein